MFKATTVVVAALLTSSAYSQPAGPACQEAPAGSSKQILDCYEDACTVYRAAWQACQSSGCRAAAGAQYALDIGNCWTGRTNQISTDPWVTFWYSGDDFGIAFDNDIPEGSKVFQF